MLCAAQILGAYGDLVAGYFSRDDARTLSAVSKYFADCRSALAQAEACEREVIQRTDAAVGVRCPCGDDRIRTDEYRNGICNYLAADEARSLELLVSHEVCPYAGRNIDSYTVSR